MESVRLFLDIERKDQTERWRFTERAMDELRRFDVQPFPEEGADAKEAELYSLRAFIPPKPKKPKY